MRNVIGRGGSGNLLRFNFKKIEISRLIILNVAKIALRILWTPLIHTNLSHKLYILLAIIIITYRPEMTFLLAKNTDKKSYKFRSL
jgi:hypothetical protein